MNELFLQYFIAQYTELISLVGGKKLKGFFYFPDFHAVASIDSSDLCAVGSNCAHVPRTGDQGVECNFRIVLKEKIQR